MEITTLICDKCGDKVRQLISHDLWYYPTGSITKNKTDIELCVGCSNVFDKEIQDIHDKYLKIKAEGK